MRTLYFSLKPIYPTVDGGCFAMESFLKSLQLAVEEIHYFSLSTEKHKGSQELFQTKFPNIPSHSFKINTKVNPFAVVLDFIHPKSYNIARFHKQSIHQELITYIEKHQIELLIVESIFLANYLNDLPTKIKTIIRTHNVEHELWQTYAKFESNIFKKLIYLNIAKKIKKEEINILNKVDFVFNLSAEDQSVFQKLNISEEKMFHIPIGLEIKKREIEIDTTKICHLGSMNWKPNQQAVEILKNEIFPFLKVKHPKLELHLAGFKLQTSNKDQNTGIYNHGFVANPIDFYAKHGMLVTPIHIASGVRVKILEALANGIPVITSQEGAKGIPDLGQFIICTSNKAMIEAISKCIEDQNFVLSHIEKAYDYIDKKHNLKQISVQIKSIIGGNF